MCIEKGEFTLIFPVSIQHHKIHSSFLSFHICNILLWQWVAWIPLSLIDLLIILIPCAWSISPHGCYHPLPTMDALLTPLGFWHPVLGGHGSLFIYSAQMLWHLIPGHFLTWTWSLRLTPTPSSCSLWMPSCRCLGSDFQHWATSLCGHHCYSSWVLYRIASYSMDTLLRLLGFRVPMLGALLCGYHP